MRLIRNIKLKYSIIHHLLLLREGVEPCRFAHGHGWTSCRGTTEIPEKCPDLENIFPVFFTDKPISRRPEVEVAGEVGEAGVEVARNQLAVSGWSGGGQRGHHGGHTCRTEGQQRR